MKNYTITVNGNVYEVTVEEGPSTGAAAPRAAAPAPKAAPAAPPVKPVSRPVPAAKPADIRSSVKEQSLNIPSFLQKK